MGVSEPAEKHVRGAGIRSALRRTKSPGNDRLGDEFGDDAPVQKKPEELEPGQLPSALIRRLREIAHAEADMLPKDASQERMARRRLSRSQSETLLKQGLSLESVAKATALRVLEKWLFALRSFASKEELPHVLAAIVHGEPQDPSNDEGELSEAEASSRPASRDPSKEHMRRMKSTMSMASTSEPTSHKVMQKRSTVISIAVQVKAPVPRRVWRNLKLPTEPDQHPLPPPQDPLGAALRSVVPLPADLRHRARRQERAKHSGRPVSPPWSFVTDILQVTELEEKLHLDRSWPDNAERQALRQTGGIKGVDRVQAPCFIKKDKEKQAGKQRRAPLAVDLSLRLSGDQSWANYRAGSGMRATFVGFNAQVFNSRPENPSRDVPGPGTYERDGADPWPLLSVKGGRRALYASVGKPRAAGGEVSLSQSDRFFFRKGDPRYRDPE
eukprot:TRINITY_DN5758_c0_g1_i1.p1 TRINITY_DN5758_c0_g1~~TRINITY_DN5758_c0_g1_i1.p1  ORF type:complete len:453 (+),score=88.84 TRINITY_DN5758_c0_g1_i1:36-1361(+)